MAIELLSARTPALPWRTRRRGPRPGPATSRARRSRAGRGARAFAAWLERVAPSGSRPVFVALNAPFDWMFVADAAWRHLGRNPFGTSALDIKALYIGRHLDEVGPLARHVPAPDARALPG